MNPSGLPIKVLDMDKLAFFKNYKLILVIELAGVTNDVSAFSQLSYI